MILNLKLLKMQLMLLMLLMMLQVLMGKAVVIKTSRGRYKDVTHAYTSLRTRNTDAI